MPRCTWKVAPTLAGLLSLSACKQLNPDFVPSDEGTSTDTMTSDTTTATSLTSSTFTTSMADDMGSLDSSEDSVSATTSTPSTSVDDGSSGAECDDVDGDNETPAGATALDEQACEADPATFDGVIAGSDDEDWLALPGVYTGNTECGNDDPVTSLALDDDTLVVCGYLRCNDGNPTVGDCGDGSDANGPDGEPGCCGGSSVQITFNCAGSTDESGTILVHVSAANAVECAAYELTSDFDSI